MEPSSRRLFEAGGLWNNHGRVECKHLQHCPIFARFKNDGGKAVWLELYCRSNFEDCERFKIRSAGGDPPVTMLPNGSHVAHLAEPD